MWLPALYGPLVHTMWRSSCVQEYCKCTLLPSNLILQQYNGHLTQSSGLSSNTLGTHALEQRSTVQVLQYYIINCVLAEALVSWLAGCMVSPYYPTDADESPMSLPHPEQVMHWLLVIPNPSLPVPPPTHTQTPADTKVFRRGPSLCGPQWWQLTLSIIWVDPHIFNMKNICILKHSLHSLMSGTVNIYSEWVKCTGNVILLSYILYIPSSREMPQSSTYLHCMMHFRLFAYLTYYGWKMHLRNGVPGLH